MLPPRALVAAGRDPGGEFAVVRVAVPVRKRGAHRPPSRSPVRPAACQFNCTFTARHPGIGGANRSESERYAKGHWRVRLEPDGDGGYTVVRADDGLDAGLKPEDPCQRGRPGVRERQDGV